MTMDKKLKRGFIAVRKAELREHGNLIRKFLREIDSLMTQPQSHERGKKIATAINQLDFARQCFERHILEIDLNKLGYEKDIK